MNGWGWLVCTLLAYVAYLIETIRIYPTLQRRSAPGVNAAMDVAVIAFVPTLAFLLIFGLPQIFEVTPRVITALLQITIGLIAIVRGSYLLKAFLPRILS